MITSQALAAQNYTGCPTGYGSPPATRGSASGSAASSTPPLKAQSKGIESNQCGICLDFIEEINVSSETSRISAANCQFLRVCPRSHWFHRACIQPWVCRVIQDAQASRINLPPDEVLKNLDETLSCPTCKYAYFPTLNKLPREEFTYLLAAVAVAEKSRPLLGQVMDLLQQDHPEDDVLVHSDFWFRTDGPAEFMRGLNQVYRFFNYFLTQCVDENKITSEDYKSLLTHFKFPRELMASVKALSLVESDTPNGANTLAQTYDAQPVSKAQITDLQERLLPQLKAAVVSVVLHFCAKSSY